MTERPRATSLTAGRGTLSTDEIAALVAARHGARKLRRAAGVAVFSGWSMGIFAAMTFLGLLFGDLGVIGPGLALSIFAWNELRGAALLRRFDARGPRLLGLNQLALAGFIVVYSGWSLYAAMGAPMLASVGGSTGDPGLDATIIDIEKRVYFALYITLAVVGVIVPSLTAWYYFSRARLVRVFLAQTPEWVAQTLRAAA